LGFTNVDKSPAISIIVPAYNEEKLLAVSLQAVKAAASAFTAAGLTWELVVCDNNSTDRTAEIARAETAKVVFEPVNQIGRARNTGASVATGEWLLFIDADSQPSRELLADAAALTARADVLLAGATITLEEQTLVVRLLCGVWNSVSRLRRLVAGSFILVRAKAFREVGGFNLSFYAGEELDLARSGLQATDNLVYLERFAQAQAHDRPRPLARQRRGVPSAGGSRGGAARGHCARGAAPRRLKALVPTTAL
jgi:cellulose synthase/poly-beta-1,6-N-acetylglucosamine synthase-like glycosyltransferase